MKQRIHRHVRVTAGLTLLTLCWVVATVFCRCTSSVRWDQLTFDSRVRSSDWMMVGAAAGEYGRGGGQADGKEILLK